MISKKINLRTVGLHYLKLFIQLARGPFRLEPIDKEQSKQHIHPSELNRASKLELLKQKYPVMAYPKSLSLYIMFAEAVYNFCKNYFVIFKNKIEKSLSR